MSWPLVSIYKGSDEWADLGKWTWGEGGRADRGCYFNKNPSDGQSWET